MSWKFFLFAAGACLVITLAAFVTEKKGTSEFESGRQIIAMRKIAHDVLRSVGDSTSQVLPVLQVSENEYRIPFSTHFSFKPDSLVSLINKTIEANDLPSSYLVNVYEQKSSTVIFGYAMLGNQQTNIIPCVGREQPVMQYAIHIVFKDSALSGIKWISLTGIGLAGIGMLMFVVQRSKKKEVWEKRNEEEPVLSSVISIGKYAFNPDDQVLMFENEVIRLTGKESKLLSLFAQAPNQIIDRSKLQKDVWEDEGVFVGRSLDMFVSKLRRKLEKDPALKLINIHGKGYKLEIS